MWTLGAPEIDTRLGPAGLDAGAVHEIKPGLRGAADGASHTVGHWASDWAASVAFALCLAARRLAEMPAGRDPRENRILWCWPEKIARETGRLHGPGLARLGLAPSSLIIVETARAADTLWALEEGLKSGSLALAAGILGEVALTPARRLSLAGQESLTPTLLVTDARAPPAGATATRWRIRPAPSAPHPFGICDGLGAPGEKRIRVTLERCRRHPESEASSLVLEWSDETHRFRLAPALENRAPAPAHTRRRAG